MVPLFARIRRTKEWVPTRETPHHVPDPLLRLSVFRSIQCHPLLDLIRHGHFANAAYSEDFHLPRAGSATPREVPVMSSGHSQASKIMFLVSLKQTAGGLGTRAGWATSVSEVCVEGGHSKTTLDGTKRHQSSCEDHVANHFLRCS